MTESNILRSVLLAASRFATVFRNNCGVAWSQRDNRAVPVRFGLTPGSSDVIGWTPITIMPEHTGQTVAIFTAIECKSATGRATTQQSNFLQAVANAGGISILARSDSDVTGILSEATRGQRVWGRVHGEMSGARRPRK